MPKTPEEGSLSLQSIQYTGHSLWIRPFHLFWTHAHPLHQAHRCPWYPERRLGTTVDTAFQTLPRLLSVARLWCPGTPIGEAGRRSVTSNLIIRFIYHTLVWSITDIKGFDTEKSINVNLSDQQTEEIRKYQKLNYNRSTSLPKCWHMASTVLRGVLFKGSSRKGRQKRNSKICQITTEKAKPDMATYALISAPRKWGEEDVVFKVILHYIVYWSHAEYKEFCFKTN